MFKYGKKKPQGATRNTARASRPAAEGSSLPSWLLVGLGMGIGLFIAFMLYLWKPWQPVKRPAPAPVAETPDTPPAEKETGEPRFDFYRLLPSQKVVQEEPVDGEVPAAVPPPPKPAAAPSPVTAEADRRRAEAILEDRKPAPESRPDAATEPRKPAPAVKPVEKPTAKDNEKPVSPKAKEPVKPKDKSAEKDKDKEKAKEADATRYSLQAGSFKSQAEAERRKAKVALSGLPARIQQVKVKEGEIWYRVIVGPFKGKAATDKAQGSLRGDGVDSLAIKEKK